MTRFSVLVALGLACVACAADHDQPAQQAAKPAAATGGCIDAGGGFLQAQLRGALVADLDWKNAEMRCEGGPRPDGKGLRVTFAGGLPAAQHTGEASTPRQLRFIFGIDEHDTAAGAVQALPTNLTVILEGEQQLYTTLGDDHCAVETLERTPVDGSGGKKARVHARGYCVGPATNLAGDARVLIPTFEFTGIADTEIAP
ncbi:MAG: hypothetical protein WDO12_03885 [Pseudomonadota bacterium]